MILFSFPPCSVRLAPALVYGGSNGQMIYPPLYYSRAHTTLQRDCKITNFFSFDQIFPIQNHHTPAPSTFITMTYSTLQHYPKTPTTTLRTTKTPPQNTSYQQRKPFLTPHHATRTAHPHKPHATHWRQAAYTKFKVQSRKRLVQGSRLVQRSKFHHTPHTLHLTPHTSEHQPMWQGHHHIHPCGAATNTCGKPQNHHPPPP